LFTSKSVLVGLVFMVLAVSGCAGPTPSRPKPTEASPSPSADAEIRPDPTPLAASIEALNGALRSVDRDESWKANDLGPYFEADSRYLGALTSGENCNVATFPKPQDAFNARLKLEDYNYLAISGSFEGFGLVLFAFDDLTACAEKLKPVADFVDEGFGPKNAKPWRALVPAIEDCWVNHLDCLSSNNLLVPWNSPDEFEFESDALGQLIDEGYCVTGTGNPSGLSSPGYLVCNAKSGKNIYAATGSEFIIKQVASTYGDYSDLIIAGDGWILKFDSGFSEKEIAEMQKITGGKRVTR
jgi:hypothetical protein